MMRYAQNSDIGMDSDLYVMQQDSCELYDCLIPKLVAKLSVPTYEIRKMKNQIVDKSVVDPSSYFSSQLVDMN